MSSTLIFVGLPEDSKSSITKVPNAPKSCIGEIFSSDATDSSPVKNGAARPRVVRDTPTRPRDTHSRLFGQTANSSSVAPMVTDTIRSHIQFGEGEMNGGSLPHSPSKAMTNGSATSTPSREGNPITGDGYKSMNGQINTVTSINGTSHLIHHSRVPPGGFSSGLW
ncbi:microtubule-associated protein Jupiter-like isoform X4 [Ostrinia furnacalis]|uniref:microtubule-associated protein Jupiter-like isoform X4 n=1 Tax=Ostrinia furnacalis TaxID=93504 RepID=UPI00103E75C3|nr:microtubule-associated protein Jupiter-like isoform X4 [Ostrinia furnacalis]